MTDTSSNGKLLADLTVGIPGAGRRTLLEALGIEPRLPADFRLCVLDAERLRDPAQLTLLNGLAAEPGLRVLYALNKLDRITGPRTTVTRTLNLLRERGIAAPELYPVCAAAARLFRLPADDPARTQEELAGQGSYYYRYGPGENCLPAFAFTDGMTLPLGSREVTPVQLEQAMINTGVPALAARLRSLVPAAPEEAAEPAAEEPAAEEAVPAEAIPAAPAAEEAAAPVPEEAAAAASAAEEPASPASAPEEAAPPAEPVSEEAVPAAPAAEEPAAPAAGEPAAEEAAPTESIPAEPVSAEPASAAETPAGPGEAVPAEAAEPGPVEEFLNKDFLPEELLRPEPPAEAAPAAPAPEEPAPVSRLDELVAKAAEADCAGILALAKAVAAEEASVEARNGALDVLEGIYRTRQTEELDALTQGAEALDLPSLRALVDRINSGSYTVQARTPYTERLNRRLDELQTEALAELCADVERADARELARIREALERTDCAEVLKTEFFRRVEDRQEALDLDALERVTAGAETMSEKELRALAVTLEANNWNPKHVGVYRHKVALCREAAVYRELEDELADLDVMERRELLSLRERIAGRDLPARFTAAPLARIDERLYRMDMLRLMAKNNQFDLLDFDGIDDLRAEVVRGDWCLRARNDYLTRLLQREEALILENTDARAQLVRQLIGQHKMRMTDFSFAGPGPDYKQRLAAYWGGTGLETPRDIPVFLLDNASDYAMTGARFYYKMGRDLSFEPVENISRFQIMRQKLSLFLQIVRKDNTYLLTNARLGRGSAERTLDFLNECVQRWNEPGLAGAPSAHPIRTRGFEAAAFTAPVEPCLPDAAMALEIFRARLAAGKLRDGNLIREGEEGWEQRTRRLLQNFGLPETTPLIWYCSSTLLGTVKEGVAVGPLAIYQKAGKLPTQVIPLEEIYSLTQTGKQATVTTVRGQSFRLDLPTLMVSPVEDYIRAIQLGNYLRRQEGRA